MEEKPFRDKLFEPTDYNIKKILSSTFSYCKELIKNTGAFSQQWNYSKSSGWILKVYDKKKALFYLIPYEKGFQLSLAIRENERDIFLKDQEIDYLKEELIKAKKYSEGYAMRFMITDKKTFLRSMLFINKIIALRK